MDGSRNVTNSWGMVLPYFDIPSLDSSPPPILRKWENAPSSAENMIIPSFERRRDQTIFSVSSMEFFDQFRYSKADGLRRIRFMFKAGFANLSEP